MIKETKENVYIHNLILLPYSNVHKCPENIK